MYKKSFSLLLFLVTVMICVGCSTPTTSTPTITKTPIVEKKTSPRVCLETTCFDVEIADDGPERQKGLMGRTELAMGAGMLFIFSRAGLWQFRMKDTYIPLDILRLDTSGTVLHMAERLPPCLAEPCPTYGPSTGSAWYVLEIGSGVAASTEISVGKTLQIHK